MSLDPQKIEILICISTMYITYTYQNCYHPPTPTNIFANA